MSNIDNSAFSTYYACLHDLERPQLPMAVQMAGDEQCDASYRIVRDNAPVSVLLYLESGRGSVLVNGQEEQLVPGDLLVLPEGLPHIYQARRDDPWRILWFNLSGELFPQLLRRYGLDKQMVYRQVETEVVSAIREGLACCQEENDRSSLQDRLCIQVYGILLALARQYRQQGAWEIGSAARLRRYMDDCLSADQSWSFSLEEAAQRMNLSVRQLERAFKEQYRQPPYAYFQAQKLAIARQYLLHTVHSIKEISELLGFCDPYYFSNCFKKQEGCSPSTFRKSV